MRRHHESQLTCMRRQLTVSLFRRRLQLHVAPVARRKAPRGSPNEPPCSESMTDFIRKTCGRQIHIGKKKHLGHLKTTSGCRGKSSSKGPFSGSMLVFGSVSSFPPGVVFEDVATSQTFQQKFKAYPLMSRYRMRSAVAGNRKRRAFFIFSVAGFRASKCVLR